MALLKTKDVAEYLAVSEDVVQDLVRQGCLVALDVSPHHGSARHRPAWRFRPEDVEKFLLARATQAAPKPSRRRRTSGDVIRYV